MTLAEIYAANDADEVLAARAGAGDRDALEQLCRRHLDKIHAICRRITCHPEDAADATQEALIALCRGIAQFDGRSTFATWLYRVTTNAAFGEIRRRGRRPEPMPDTAVWGAEGTSWGTLVDQSPAAGVDVRIDIDAALERIPPDYRAAVILRDLCDLDYPTIGAVLGLPQGTVRSRIHRGRQALTVSLATHAPPRNDCPSA